MSIDRTRSGRASIASDLAVQIAKNLLMGSKAVRRWRTARPRTSGDSGDAKRFLAANAFNSLDLLLEHVGDLRGKSVCEIGAGDYLTSGLAILAAGAEKYAVIDRFPGDYFGETAKYWYRQLAEHWNDFHPAIDWNPEIDAHGFPENAGDKLTLIGEPLETADAADRFDIVCSFQVGEHVSDIDAFAEVHNRLLTTGGVGLHRVDFGPHDVWFTYRDPGVFLRFSDRIWNLTGSNRGVPNRKRHHEFLDTFERAGLDVEVLFTDNFDRSAMDLTKLAAKFKAMPLESVLTGTAVYRVTRRTR